ncbi:MAG: M6 family metalloprotease domain-containing protein [Endomicrobium sp.]|jgi:M6 family metalloprotease-like protein|nr:M6 family metalloprotease domain-containing protein [Endomicrobium sp.]
MNYKIKIAIINLIILTVLFCVCGVSLSVPAAPGFFEAVQPDGTKIEIQMKGDEFYGWAEDRNGYTVIQDNASKEWRYAQEEADGSIKSSSFRVGKSLPQGFNARKGLRYRNYKEIAKQRRTQMQPANADNPILQRLRSSSVSKVSAQSLSSAPEKAPAAGTIKNLVVLVAFADKSFTLANPKQQFEDLYNKIGYSGDGGKGSVKDFFLKASFGALTVESVVTDIITLDNTVAYYGANTSSAGGSDIRPREMVVDALKKLEDSGFDFSQFSGNEIEGVTIIHAGRGEEAGGGANTIWSHKWNITRQQFGGKYVYTYNTAPELYYSNITTIGVLCHEFGHVIGLPDLYDTNGGSEGVGNFCLMGSGSWNFSGGNSGNSPSLFSAWCKKELGYINIQNLPNNSVVSINTSSEDSSAVYKFSGNGFNSKEYFLIENRQGTSFDAGLPGPNRGILIWHIDDTRENNDNESRYMVDLEEADGSNDLAMNRNRGRDSHYFRAGNKAEFTDTTTPNSKSYSGLSSGYPITNISASGAVMTFTVGTPHVVGSIDSVSPSTTTRTTTSVNITGENLAQGSIVKLVKDGIEIPASSVSYISPSNITAVFPIFSTAPAGYWDLQISSDIYSNNPIEKANAVFVQVSDAIINSVSPSTTTRITTSVNITGENLAQGSIVKLVKDGIEIPASSVSYISASNITAVFPIFSTAPAGYWDLQISSDIYSNNPIEKANAVFVQVSDAVINTVSPSTTTRTTTSVNITGENLAQGSIVKLVKDGIEIPASSVSYLSASNITAVFPIFSTAPAGYWDLQISSDIYSNNPIEKANAVFVQVSDAIINSVSPSTTTRTTTSVNITGENLAQGSIVKLVKDGIEIPASSVSYISGSNITAVFPIFSTAPAGYWDLQISSDIYSNNPIEKANAVFVQVSDASIDSVSPSTTTRITTSVNITGENLAQGSIVKLVKDGIEIPASSVSYLSSSNITAVFPIFSTAPAGYWDLQISSDIYSNNPIEKANAVFVKGNMSISHVAPEFVFAGTAQTFEITGTEYQSGAVVKLTNGGVVLTGTILDISETSVDASFQIPPDIAHGAQFDLTIINANGDSISKANAVSIYKTPSITQAAPLNAAPNEQAVLTLSGENFTPLTKITLKKLDNTSEIIVPQTTFYTDSSIGVSFTPQHLQLGKWKIYIAPFENGQEIEFSGQLEIKYPDPSCASFSLKAYSGGNIIFPVRSVNGTLNDGYAVIPEMTFNTDVEITVKQQTSFAKENSNAGILKHSNIGVSIDAQSNMNANGINLKIPYTQDDISSLDENNLVIAVYDEEKGVWVPFKSFVDKDNKLVCAQIDRLGVFAIMGFGVSASFNNIKYFPNPIRPSKGLSYSKMNFANLPAECKIIIYTQLGRIVRKLESDNAGMAVWDAKNSSGEHVASGAYIAYIEDKNGNKKKIKIAVER